MMRVGAFLAAVLMAPLLVMPQSGPASAAVPGEHRVYVVYVTSSGDLPTSPDVLAAGVDQALARWSEMAPSGFTSFARVGAPVPYAAPAPGTPGCGVANVIGGLRRYEFAQVEQAVGMGHAPPGVAEHLVLLMPSSCYRGFVPGDPGSGPYTWYGGTQGSSFDSGGDIVLFDNATTAWTADGLGRTLVTDFGHNLGIQPSGLGCVPPGSDWKSCHPDFAGDGNCYSPMGMMGAGMSLSTAERAAAGLLEPGETTSLDGLHGPVDQVVTLQPRGSTTGLRGVVVDDPETGETYYLDHRVKGGLDQPRYTVPGCADGLVVTVPAGFSGTLALPPVAAQPIGSSRVSWQPGETLLLSSAVRLDVLSADPTGAQVRVRITPGPAFDHGARLTHTELAQASPVTVSATGFSPKPQRLGYRWYVDGQLLRTQSWADFIMVPDDAHSLTVEVKAFHAGRSYSVARATWPVGKNLVRASKHPRLKGRFAVGGRVTASFRHDPRGPGRLRLRYGWYADGRLLARSRHKSLRLPPSVAGKRVSVVVTITGHEVQKAVRSSRPSRPVVRG